MSMYLMYGFFFFIISLLSLTVGLNLMISETVYLIDLLLMSWGGIDIKYEIVFDWISCIYLGVVMMISGSVLIYSEEYMSKDINKKRFLLLMILFVISMILMVISGGMISVLLGWDGLGLVSYCLVIYYGSVSSYKAGMITILSNRVGDVLLLVSVGLLYVYGDWNFYLYKFEEFNLWNLISVMIILAACTKSAQVPFCAWLPEASAAPTPVSSLVHSSTLVTAGVFLMIRFNYLFEVGSELLMFISLMTSMIAGLSALFEMDFKKVVAMSTLSQLGFMMFCLSVGLWRVAYFHMVIHAFFKALMFLCMGSIIYGMGGNQDFRFISSKIKCSWIINQGFLISVMCLMGFPFLCGFYSKDLIIELMLLYEKSVFMFLFFILGVGMGSLYSVRLYEGSIFGLGMEGSYSGYGEKKWMNVGILILLFMSLFSGSMLGWLFSLDYTIILDWKLKILGLLLMSLFLSLMLMMKFYKGFMSSHHKYMGLFFGGLCFMKESSGGVWMKSVDFMIEVEKLDQEWVEEYGGGGIKMFLEFVFKVYELAQEKSFFIFMFYIFFMALFVGVLGV